MGDDRNLTKSESTPQQKLPRPTEKPASSSLELKIAEKQLEGNSFLQQDPSMSERQTTLLKFALFCTCLLHFFRTSGVLGCRVHHVLSKMIARYLRGWVAHDYARLEVGTIQCSKSLKTLQEITASQQECSFVLLAAKHISAAAGPQEFLQ